MHRAANVAASRPTSAENVFNPEKGDEKQIKVFAQKMFKNLPPKLCGSQSLPNALINIG